MADLTPYLVAVIIVVGSLLLLGFRRRILLRIGVRNFLRRRSQVALAVAGLLIATSIISGSLVMGDSFRETVRDFVFRGLYLVDEIVWAGNGSATASGDTRPAFADAPKALFLESIYTSLRDRKADLPHVDGLEPRIVLSASVLDTSTGFIEPASHLIAFDPSQDFDTFFVRGAAYDGADLPPGEIILNTQLAGELEARVGDALTFFTTEGNVSVRVHALVDDAGKGAVFLGPNVFVRLSDLQASLNLSGQINGIFVSNAGGVETGYQTSDQAVAELASVVPKPLTIDPVKANGLVAAENSTQWITQIFAVLGTFTVIAGVLLIVNIFVVLAEERKSEMGISRALGMRRTHLTETFVFEGLLYALAASAIGTIAGLGVAAFGILSFSSLFSGPSGLSLTYHFEFSSLVIAFAIGFLVTILVVVLASWRVSRLNIVRAIRNLPEPLVRKGTRGLPILGVIASVLGLLGIWQAIALRSPLLVIVGPSLLAYGIAGVAQRVVGARLAYTGGALAVVAWALYPPRFDLYTTSDFPFDAFLVAGILLVMSAVAALMFNSRVLLRGLTWFVGRRGALRPIVKTAVSYPMARRGRTGLTLAIFALVVFIITVASMFAALFFGNVEQLVRDQSGGYDIGARADIPRPGANFDADFRAASVSSNVAYYSSFNGSVATILANATGPVSYPVFGIRPPFGRQNDFPFASLLPKYGTGREAWDALAADSNLTILDSGFGGGFGSSPLNAGDRVAAANVQGERHTFTVIGVLREFLINGMFVSDASATNFFFARAPTAFLFKVVSGVPPDDVKRDLDRDFVAYGMEATVFRELIDQIMQFNLSFIRILQSFLALGLIVGVAGLGVVTMRNVVERKNEIGTLRAIGFRRGMVLKYLLIENSFVSLLGIGIGMALGIVYAYYMFLTFLRGSQSPIVIPWLDLAAIALVAYVAGLLATVPPSRKAARLPPAEALRTVE